MFTHALRRIDDLQRRLHTSHHCNETVNCELAKTRDRLREQSHALGGVTSSLDDTKRQLDATRAELASVREENSRLQSLHDLGKSVLVPREELTSNCGHICASFRKHCNNAKPHNVTVVISLSSRELTWGKYVSLPGPKQELSQSVQSSIPENNVEAQSDNVEVVRRPRGFSMPVQLQRAPSRLRSIGKSAANKRLLFDDISEVRIMPVFKS